MASAETKSAILDCMQPVYLDDPTFQQGSEKYFDIFLVDGKKVQVELTTGELQREVILFAEDNTTASDSIKDGDFHAFWDGPHKVALILRDFGTRWRGMLMFPDGYQSERLNMDPGAEIDLACVLKPGSSVLE